MAAPTAKPQTPLMRFWLRNWFLICLTVCIVGGLWIGDGVGSVRHQAVQHAVGSTLPKVIVTCVLLMMSITLPTRDLRQALRAPGPSVWACVVNLLVIPLLAWPLMSLQTTDDFRMGLLIAASVPCTLAAASVWTRSAGGNDAVSLLVTAATNGLCWVVSPFWLSALGGHVVELDVEQLAVTLMISGLLPILAGQFLRQWSVIGRWVDAHKRQISIVAQCCILTLVAWAAFQGGPEFAAGGRAEISGFCIVGLCCVMLHLAGMGIAVAGCRLAGFERRDMIAVAFAGSQKTLPIGILLADEVGLPLALLPMLMFHASQLFIDTPIASRLATRGLQLQPAAAKDAVDQPDAKEA